MPLDDMKIFHGRTDGRLCKERQRSLSRSRTSFAFRTRSRSSSRDQLVLRSRSRSKSRQFKRTLRSKSPIFYHDRSPSPIGHGTYAHMHAISQSILQGKFQPRPYSRSSRHRSRSRSITPFSSLSRSPTPRRRNTSRRPPDARYFRSRSRSRQRKLRRDSLSLSPFLSRRTLSPREPSHSMQDPAHHRLRSRSREHRMKSRPFSPLPNRSISPLPRSFRNEPFTGMQHSRRLSPLRPRSSSRDRFARLHSHRHYQSRSKEYRSSRSPRRQDGFRTLKTTRQYIFHSKMHPHSPPRNRTFGRLSPLRQDTGHSKSSIQSRSKEIRNSRSPLRCTSYDLRQDTRQDQFNSKHYRRRPNSPSMRWPNNLAMLHNSIQSRLHSRSRSREFRRSRSSSPKVNERFSKLQNTRQISNRSPLVFHSRSPYPRRQNPTLTTRQVSHPRLHSHSRSREFKGRSKSREFRGRSRSISPQQKEILRKQTRQDHNHFKLHQQSRSFSPLPDPRSHSSTTHGKFTFENERVHSISHEWRDASTAKRINQSRVLPSTGERQMPGQNEERNDPRSPPSRRGNVPTQTKGRIHSRLHFPPHLSSKFQPINKRLRMPHDSRSIELNTSSQGKHTTSLKSREANQNARPHSNVFSRLQLSTQDAKPTINFMSGKPKGNECAGSTTSKSEKEEELRREIDADFKVYEEVPEIHPEYEEQYGIFIVNYLEEHADDDESHLERQWMAYWKKSLVQLKAKLLKEKLNKLVGHGNKTGDGGPNQMESDLDLEAIAKATLGQNSRYTLDRIKISLKKLHEDVSSREINDIFLQVCSLQRKMTK